MKLRTDRLPLVLALFCLLCGAALAADDTPIPLDSDGLPMWVEKEWTDFPVRLVLADREALDALLQQVPIASFNREQIAVEFTSPKQFHLVFTPRVTDREYAALAAAGYRPEKVRDRDREGREEAKRTWRRMAAEGKLHEKVETYPLTYYPTNDQIGTMLMGLQADYPDLAEYFTWGASVDGRTLHGIVISDNVATEEAEPEVRLSSSIHGDEVVGMVMLTNFAYYLLENYGQPGMEDVTDLVDNYEIHLIPLYNPDGNAAHQRYNSNGVDLNRNFPEPAGTHTIREVETVQFMSYSSHHHFVHSANLHGGALVMNYPWDYTYDLTPDDAMLPFLALEYSTYNEPMYYDGLYPQGIVRGAIWYVVTGSLQDWSYDQTDCIDITAEISNVKWPSASTLAGYWDDNRESLMHYTKAARYGINGVVTGADSGLPLDATVTIVGIDKPVHTDPDLGDYYKQVQTGTFDVMVEAEGYVTQTIHDVATTWGTPTVLDVAMQPLATGHVSGVVTDEQGGGLEATIEVVTLPGGDLVATIPCDASGAYASDLYYGDYTLTATAPDHFPESQPVTISGTPAVADFVLGGMVVSYPIDEDFETGAGAFTGDWFVTDQSGHDSASSLTDSDGSYPDYADLVTTTSSVDLSGIADPTVSFWARWNIEASWDAVYFEISTGGGAWSPLATEYTGPASGQGAQLPAGEPCFDGDQAGWVLNTVDLAPYVGEGDVRFRFRLVSDSSIHYDGFYVDDFSVRVIGQVTGVDTPQVYVAKVAAYPNPFNPQTRVAFENPRAGRVDLAIFDLQGRHVRTLLGTDLPAGENSVVWDGRTDAGRQAGSGVYFARLVAGDATASAKLMLVK